MSNGVDLDNLPTPGDDFDIDAILAAEAKIGEDDDSGSTNAGAVKNDVEKTDAQLEEGEETDEERAEREAAEAKALADSRIRIPKPRFDEAVAAERQRAEAAQRRAEAAEQRLAEMEGKSAKEAEVTPEQIEAYIDQQQDKYEELLIAGEGEKAREVRAEIKNAQKYLSEQLALQAAHTVTQSSRDEQDYMAAVKRIETAYPALNPASNSYDEAKVDEILFLATGMMKNGMSSTHALARATNLLMGPPKASAASAAAAAAAATAKQPPVTAKGGRNAPPTASDNVDLTSMSQEQFDKLDDATMKKLMGY